jgi:hypothetical protein
MATSIMVRPCSFSRVEIGGYGMNVWVDRVGFSDLPVTRHTADFSSTDAHDPTAKRARAATAKSPIFLIVSFGRKADISKSFDCQGN